MLTIASCFIVCLEHLFLLFLLDHGKLSISSTISLQTLWYFVFQFRFITNSEFSLTLALVLAIRSSSNTACLQ